jgi:hypothetical protein
MSPSLLIGHDADAIPPIDFKAVMQSPAQMQNSGLPQNDCGGRQLRLCTRSRRLRRCGLKQSGPARLAGQPCFYDCVKRDYFFAMAACAAASLAIGTRKGEQLT